MPRYIIERPRESDNFVRTQAVYKLGRLDSILWGHAACCPDFDNAVP